MGISSLCASSSRSLSAISYTMSKVSQESPPTMKARYSKGSPFQKVHPVVAKKFGDRTARLFSALEYWFYSMKSDKFFKFIEPCNNKNYRKGDSWSEELELNRLAIVRASRKIIKLYRSKSTYLAALNTSGATGVFCGMPYLSYYDNHTHQTFYLRNAVGVSDILSGSLPSTTTNNVLYGTYHIDSCRTYQYDTCTPINMIGAVASEPAVYQPIQTPTKNTTKNISLSISLSEENGVQEQPKKEREIKNVFMEQPEQPEQVEHPIRNIMEIPDGDQSIGIVSQMIDIWVKITGKDVNRTHGEVVTERLKLAYSQAFESSIEKWEEYCKLLLTSKFLMGEIPSKLTGKGYELNLTHACKLEEIEKVLSGGYTMGDRSKTVNIPLKELQDNDPIVLKFKNKCLEVMGEHRYVAWVQGCKITRNINGEMVYIALNNFCADFVAACDMLGFGNFIKSIDVPAVLICKPDGSVVSRIEGNK